ncbi:class I SAM-dependent methyltransferase [Brachyspira hyodysenteriae]|uniref:class I SAM-dependent methyltransferase n=1 Tax=Brachyspira hyodysenteriae TaxID=159 RepID=UPI0022CDB99E|nr:class I SAM-dependent methyltransferase [Brachyspira hyodysenteriae]MCZ9840471.1 class I SAM-dependent methyltransferase [Brachyspira hyodysenteriae]MCZ9848859.1 class I SAM-dependent methyltransferase [Brachyspira hyodysenteriae]MCZ9852339.1 class I SAM-dependent methyltransferase [Brachyspira hyodysenteriae]MCZ9861963.1 class I SAM-dependent methyltransferase [Brachyspira hyodysenteriae]MCZ9869210.1 class I SAM-dependent methyltransferase [Brachyspira hyodysenteriae]
MFVNIENFDIEILDEINNILDIDTNGNKISEMFYIERKFLNGIIRKLKPKKILEIGVAAGGSSAIILNAIKDIDNANLYSVDYLNMFYRDANKKVGFIIDEKFSHLNYKRHLYTGGVVGKFIDDIGGDIDVCILDAMHSNPGEILDFLMVLPYLKKNAVIIIHDIFISYTCSSLFETLQGKKFTPNIGNKLEAINYPGIGAVVLNDNINDIVENCILLLIKNWNYMPNDIDIKYAIEIFKKNYNSDIVDTFNKIAVKNYINFKVKEEKENFIKSYIDNINKKAWWIPIKKIRNDFRVKKLSLISELSYKDSFNIKDDIYNKTFL